MKVVKVTPKKAAEWLKRNTSNRPIRSTRVDSYAAAMSASQWKLNGETIKFNCNGDLCDGQHRLHACVKSGYPFESYVIHGVPVEAFDTIDQGDKRKISDIFARQGRKHYCLLAATVRLVWRYINGFAGTRGMMRSDEANMILEQHPNLPGVVQQASEQILDTGILPGSIVEGDGLVKKTPAYVLNRKLVSNLRSTSKLSSTGVCAICIKAWNAHVQKKPLDILRWGDQEEFPKILL